MSAYPNELFLIDDQSVPVFVIQSGNEVYNSIKQYLSGITRHENTVSANSVVVTTNNFTPYSSGMDASTVYLITYTKNTDNISYISVGGGGSNTKQIRAETIREVDDLNI